MNISKFTQQAMKAGVQDPDEIAGKYLAAALASDDPENWLLVPVRMAVGSVFSSIQKAIRGEKPQPAGARAGDDGAGVQEHSESQTAGGPGTVIADLTRQEHSEGQLWIPATRTWILYLDATIEQLEDVIAWYKGRRQELSQSIAQYRKAIKDIRSVPGATCLRDVRAAREKTA